MSGEATFQKVLNGWLTRQLEGIHTAFPASIDSYDPKTRIAKVIPGIKFRSNNGAILELKPIDSVPVMFPGGSSWEIVAPLEKGDTGLVICTESSLGNWLAGNGSQVAPEDSTRFSLHDAIFIPGLHPKSKVPASHDGLWLRYKQASLNVKESEVEITGKLVVKGAIEATEEVSALTLTPATTVKLSTHIHGTGVGPSTPPQPGT